MTNPTTPTPAPRPAPVLSFENPDADARAAYRGRHKLPTQSQLTGRDLAGERYAARLPEFVVYETTPEYRERTRTPYLWLVRTPSGTAETAFMSAAELLDWCRAYAVSLIRKPGSAADFHAFPGEPQDWETLTMREIPRR